MSGGELVAQVTGGRSLTKRRPDVVVAIKENARGRPRSLLPWPAGGGAGKNYPVRMKAGAASWNTDVAAETNSVSVPISDKKFKEGLRAASVVVVEGAGATIRIPLDQSRAALDRLEQCLIKNSRAVETNPFVAPTRQP